MKGKGKSGQDGGSPPPPPPPPLLDGSDSMAPTAPASPPPYSSSSSHPSSNRVEVGPPLPPPCPPSYQASHSNVNADGYVSTPYNANNPSSMASGWEKKTQGFTEAPPSQPTGTDPRGGYSGEKPETGIPVPAYGCENEGSVIGEDTALLDPEHVVHVGDDEDLTYQPQELAWKLPVTESAHFKDDQAFCKFWRIKVGKDKKGYYSTSRKLNHDSDALTAFLLYYNRFAPQDVCLWIEGHHNVTEVSYSTDSEGREKREERTRRVTDFLFDISLMQFIDFCTVPDIFVNEEEVRPPVDIVCNPNELNTALDYDIALRQKMSEACQQTVNDYIRNGNPTKNLKLRKHVDIDWDTLKDMCTAQIRGLGYNRTISVTPAWRFSEVRIRDNNWVSYFGQTGMGKCICFLTCFWIFFLPFYCIVKHCCFYGETERKGTCTKRLKTSWQARPGVCPVEIMRNISHEIEIKYYRREKLHMAHARYYNSDS
eukprot:Nk52_evm6s376 gene=Nk52_evmTU6s376